MHLFRVADSCEILKFDAPTPCAMGSSFTPDGRGLANENNFEGYQSRSPRLAEAETLVPASSLGWKDDAERKPGQWGARAKVCVTDDWNGDGKLDLLLGDICGGHVGKAVQTEAEKREEIHARDELPRLMEKWSATYQDYRDRRHGGPGSGRVLVQRPSAHAAADSRQQDDPQRDSNPEHSVMVSHGFTRFTDACVTFSGSSGRRPSAPRASTAGSLTSPGTSPGVGCRKVHLAQTALSCRFRLAVFARKEGG